MLFLSIFRSLRPSFFQRIHCKILISTVENLKNILCHQNYVASSVFLNQLYNLYRFRLCIFYSELYRRNAYYGPSSHKASKDTSSFPTLVCEVLRTS